jgi:hypothetical protein
MSSSTRRAGGRPRPSRKLMRYLVAILVLAIGVAGIVAGEADDSPGLQLLCAVLVVGAVVRGVRIARRGH